MKDCFEFAAERMPLGYDVMVIISAGSVAVRLSDEEGNRIDDCPRQPLESLQAYIKRLSNFAVGHEKAARPPEPRDE